MTFRTLAYHILGQTKRIYTRNKLNQGSLPNFLMLNKVALQIIRQTHLLTGGYDLNNLVIVVILYLIFLFCNLKVIDIFRINIFL